MISFSCSHCGLKLKVKPEFAGRSSKCPTCKTPLMVPRPDQTEGHVPQGQIDGTPSSIAQAGVEGGVTLGQKSVQELLSRQTKKGQRYIIQNEIARGGMGAVLLAFDSDIRREVAIKFMLDHADPKKKLRFIEEAQITGQLEHPNIPPVHEIGLDAQKRLFFSMKMVKGRSLKEVVDMLRENPKAAEKEYTLGRLLNVFVNVCNGMAYAHSRGVVHRDLKPANIMTGDFGEVYVMDWGLAKVLKLPEAQVVGEAPIATLASGASSSAPSAVSVSSSQSRPSSKVETSREPEADLTQEGAIIGTPIYMPPEQAMGEIDKIDQRSDVYALGAILYEMLTLVPPIEKEGGYLAILMRVSQGEIVPPEVRVGQSSGDVTDTSQSSGTRLLSGLKTRLKQAVAETASKLRGARPTVPWHIPAELSAIAMKALAKEKKDRYQTVEALRQDIERFQEGRSVSAKEDTKKEMLWKFVKRNKGFSAATTAALVVIAVILWFSFKYNYDARVRAEEANRAFLQEQNAKRERGKHSAPLFFRDARQNAERGQLDYAQEQVSVTLDYDPDHADARLLKGQLLIVAKEFPAARRELESYVQARPADADGALLLKLCRQARLDDGTSLTPFIEVFSRQKLWTLAERLEQSSAKLLEMYRRRIDAAWPGHGQQLTMNKEGKYHFGHPNYSRISDLTPLQGMPLTSLVLHSDQLKDLTPLQGMLLTSLDLAACVQIKDLTPLQGLKLTTLNLSGCVQIKDFTPLQGMKLTSLNLDGCPIKDLAPLQGMPLTSLSLRGCGQIKDLTPLQGMPLTSLDLYDIAADRGPLRSIKTLPTISGVPTAEFWKRYDAEQKGKK